MYPLAACGHCRFATLAFPVSCRQESLGELSVDLLVHEGAPGDPLVKYVDLPVKVLPDATFRTQLDQARRRTAERGRYVIAIRALIG